MDNAFSRQATAVAIGGRALLIEGAPGTGKTSLALMLIDRGAQLIGDDGIALRRIGQQIIAHPPETTRNLIEVRNIGIVTLPSTSAPVAIILSISGDAPRFIETADQTDVAGVLIPRIAFSLHRDGSDAIRAEHALAKYGLSTS